ncbi:Glycoside hydrolase superfamily [Phytophthora cactorum]|nr:Glycoside hydrolase superfamily [Phytophthora cactorum]
MKIFATTAALFASLSAHTATAGYVTTSGTNFELDGKPFYVFGTNAGLGHDFNTMAKNDLSVCRTWGFADLNETGTAPYNVVYQLWENGKATVNTGDNGLGYFDQVYIKSLDSNHLVASGSEGFMNTDKSVYLYSGPSGVDFDANLAIDSIDYGAYHAYPDSWGVATSEAKSWGVKWIDDHVASGKKAGKPVILEEYGIKPLDSASYLAWSNQVYTSKSNMQYWQFGVKSLSTHDDGYAIFDEDDLFSTVIAPAAKFASLSGSSTSNSTSTSTSTTASPGTALLVRLPLMPVLLMIPAPARRPKPTTEAPTATTATPSAVDASSDTAAESAADGSDTEASADTTQESTGSAERPPTPLLRLQPLRRATSALFAVAVLRQRVQEVFECFEHYLTAAFTTTEAMNRVVPAATTATPNLRVGMVRIKDGNRTADVVLVLHDGSGNGNAAVSEDISSFQNIAQLDMGDSASYRGESDAVLVHGWKRSRNS